MRTPLSSSLAIDSLASFKICRDVVDGGQNLEARRRLGCTERQMVAIQLAVRVFSEKGEG